MNANQKTLLITGPTASGKSDYALDRAERDDGIIINADSLQVFSNWQVLTARPTSTDLARAPHYLFGHVGRNNSYSVGNWLRDVESVMRSTGCHITIVGGTGLYFTRLINGLVDIPDIADDIRKSGDAMRIRSGNSEFLAYLRQNDPETLANLDQNNPMRLQRAWEVHFSSGRGVASWISTPHKSLINIDKCETVVMMPSKQWLDARIAERFDKMLGNGALAECEEALATGWNPALQSAKALGAPQLISYLRGEISLADARTQAIIATIQYAKRQRTWFRRYMPDWRWVVADGAAATR